MKWFRRLLCWMDWHWPKHDIQFDGLSYVSTCRRCGKVILMDSQGRWFTVEA